MNATPSTPRGSASSSTTAQVSPSRHTTLASSSPSTSPSRSPSGRIASKGGIQSATSPSASSARADRLASELTAEERLDLVRRNRKLTKLLGDEVVREKSHLKARSVSPRRETTATTAAAGTLPLSNSVHAQLGSDDADDGSTSCTSIFLQHVAPGSRSPPQTPLPPQMSAKAAALLGVSPSSSSAQQQQLAIATKKPSNESPSASILESSASTRQRRSLDSLQSRGSLSLSHDAAAAAASASAVPALLRSHGRAQSQHTTADFGNFAAAHESWLDLDNTLDDPTAANSNDAGSIDVDLHPNANSRSPSSPRHDRADRRRRVEKMTRWLGNVVPAHIVAPEAGNDAPAYMYDEAPLSALRFAAATSMGRTSSAPPRAGAGGGGGGGGAEDHYLRVKRANKLEQLLGEGAAAVSAMQPQAQPLGKAPINVPTAAAATAAAPRDLEAESSDDEDEDDELVDASEGESDAPRGGVHDEDAMDIDDDNDEHGARRRRAAKAQKLTRFFGQRVEQEHLVGGGGGGGAGASPAL